MVKFVAYHSQDTSDLSELGLFQNIKKNLNRKGEGSSFDASKGKIDMHVEGKGMIFVLKNPTSGKMNSVDVKVDGTDQYSVNGLGLKIRKMKTFFKGDYESKIFNGDDKLIGSKEADKLAGFDGNDLVKSGNGGDSIIGGKGNDKLYGESGGDKITGGDGNDFIDGGSGINTLTGNGGTNTFHFSTQLSADNSSAITDFRTGVDRIELVKSAFPDLSGKGKLAPDSFIKSTDYAGQDGVVVYDKSNGHVSFAIDSNNLIKFAEVSANLSLKSTDFWIV